MHSVNGQTAHFEIEIKKQFDSGMTNFMTILIPQDGHSKRIWYPTA